jgi:hypothetical protein
MTKRVRKTDRRKNKWADSQDLRPNINDELYAAEDRCMTARVEALARSIANRRFTNGGNSTYHNCLMERCRREAEDIIRRGNR